jgi:hypothetical protein
MNKNLKILLLDNELESQQQMVDKRRLRSLTAKGDKLCHRNAIKGKCLGSVLLAVKMKLHTGPQSATLLTTTLLLLLIAISVAPSHQKGMYLTCMQFSRCPGR